MKRFWAFTLIIAFLCLAAFIARPTYEMAAFIYYGIKLHQTATNKLNALSEQRIEKILNDSKRLATHSPDSNLTKDGNIPKEFLDLAPTWVAVDPDQVMIELMGGFDHMGIVVRKDESGNWHLYRYTEDSEKLLR
jgi:hypothetical protein